MEEYVDKRKITGKLNLQKAQAVLKEKRAQKNAEKSKPLELESSDSEDDQPVLTFKKKSKKDNITPQLDKITETLNVLLAKNAEMTAILAKRKSKLANKKENQVPVQVQIKEPVSEIAKVEAPQIEKRVSSILI